MPPFTAAWLGISQLFLKLTAIFLSKATSQVTAIETRQRICCEANHHQLPFRHKISASFVAQHEPITVTTRATKFRRDCFHD